MSRSHYQNVFFYYRGPSRKVPSAEAELAVDRQLENNATKALINVLAHSGSETTRCFLREVVELDVDDDGDGFVYSLLGADKEARAARRRHLVGLSMLGMVESGVAGDGDRGVIDAAICLPGELLVAFEVKIGNGVLDSSQLQRHAKTWRICDDHWKCVRWATIYEWAARQRNPALWEEVLKLLPDGDREDLREIHVGQLGLANTAHAQTNWRKRGVNLTTELYSNELQVNMVGWLQDEARRFKHWLVSDGGQRRLKELTDHQLVVYCRQAGNIDKRESGAKPWFQRERVRPLGSSAAGEASREWISSLLDQVDECWEKSAFHLRRTWSKDDVLAEGKGIAREVTDEVERLLPRVREINAATAS